MGEYFSMFNHAWNIGPGPTCISAFSKSPPRCIYETSFETIPFIVTLNTSLLSVIFSSRIYEASLKTLVLVITQKLSYTLQVTIVFLCSCNPWSDMHCCSSPCNYLETELNATGKYFANAHKRARAHGKGRTRTSHIYASIIYRLKFLSIYALRK